MIWRDLTASVVNGLCQKAESIFEDGGDLKEAEVLLEEALTILRTYHTKHRNAGVVRGEIGE